MKFSIPLFLVNNGIFGQNMIEQQRPTRYLRTRNNTQALESRNLFNLNDMRLEENIATTSAEERSGTMILDSSDLELTYDAKFNHEQKVGLYFNQVNIPFGARVSEAYLQFEADETSQGSVALEIFGEDTDQANPFSVRRNNLSNRQRTTSKAIWNPAPWTRVGDKGTAQKSSDIKGIIQEIIDRPGWKQGNALSIIIQRSQQDQSQNTRVAEKNPILTIKYTLNNEQAIITARGENADRGPGRQAEGKLQAFDGDKLTKWLDFSPISWIQYQYPGGQAPIVSSYKLTSANDVPARDPQNWKLLGSSDGNNWVELDRRSGISFGSRHETKEFNFVNESPYSTYRLDIERNHGSNIIQLAEIEFIEGSTPPTEDEHYHSHEGAGKVDRTNGYFAWGGKTLHYVNKGGLTSGGRVSTQASIGDHELVSFGASHGGGNQLKDQYFDKDKMLRQGFSPIGVRGEKDKKVEMWLRKNIGQSFIDIPNDARAYSFLVFETADLNLNFYLLEAKSVRNSGRSYSVPQIAREGLKILSYFSDDSVELTNIGEGALAFQEYGFGDGDGFAVSIYRPGLDQPQEIGINNLDPMGRQYVGINAAFTIEENFNHEMMRQAANAAEEKNGRLNLSSSDLELVYDNGEQMVGINFQAINIPQGSEIKNAYIQFQADEVSTGDLNLEIFAEQTADSMVFSNSRKISDRPLTTASVLWQPEPWTSIGEAGPKQRTEDLSPILQELVSRNDWKQGNAVSFIIKRAMDDQSINKRVAETGSNPKLYISYAPSENQPEEQDDVVILALGDGGTGGTKQYSVANSMKDVCSFEDCDFAVYVGDNIYENGVSSVDDPQFKTKFEDPYGPLEIPFYMSLGNHDIRGNTQAQIDYTELSRWWKMPGRYYAKMVDGIQLIGIDTNNFNREQLNFVKNTLENTTAQWKVVFGHHPIYSYGHHGNTAILVNQLLPLLCEHEKVIYVSGHDHDLQVLDSGCGVPLFISGAAAKSRDEGEGPRTVWADATYGYAIFRFSDEELKVKFYGEDRQLLFEETYF